MNVANDQWLLERTQQMAVSMALSAPKIGENASQPAKTEKGETFQDMMDKAKGQQKVETPEKEEAAASNNQEAVQSKEPVQQSEQTQAVKPKTDVAAKQVSVSPGEAALLAAGYACIYQPEGNLWPRVVVSPDENGDGVLSVADLMGAEIFTVGEDQPGSVIDNWVMEPTEEIVTTLEEILRATSDPRSVQDVVAGLEQRLQNAQTVEPEVEVVLLRPEQYVGPGEAGNQKNDQNADLLASGQPLFGEVDVIPEKVGDVFQLDTQETSMVDDLVETIRYAAQQGLREFEIQLSPANLGSLTIKLTESADGTIQVMIHASNAKAANLLGQHADDLRAALQGFTQNEVRVEVQRNDDSQQANQHQQTDPDGHNAQQQQQQQQRQQDDGHSGDFAQKLRLGLFELEDLI